MKTNVFKQTRVAPNLFIAIILTTLNIVSMSAQNPIVDIHTSVADPNGNYIYDYQNTQGYIGYRNGMALAPGTNGTTHFKMQVKGGPAWYDASTYRLRLNGTVDAFFYGKIGVNTSNPESGLHIKDLDNGITTEKNGVKVRMATNATFTDGWIGTISNHGLYLGTNNNNNNHTNLYLDTDDNVYVGGIYGTNVSTDLKDKYDLFVEDGILTEDIALAKLEYWADYVFGEEYDLRPLSYVEHYIRENAHLPNIPSQQEIAENGYSMHEMNVRFLEKIEELTLYIIQQEKQINELKARLDEITNK